MSFRDLRVVPYPFYLFPFPFSLFPFPYLSAYNVLRTTAIIFIKELIALNRIFYGGGAETEWESRPSALPSDTVVAMAYVPLQFYESLYELDEGFTKGTSFPELYKPFTGCDKE